jgi:mitochondrial fission protein ELM1
LILTNQLVNAKYVLLFQDGIVMIAEAISARTILTATNKIIFVEKLENVNVSAEFIKDENRLFYSQHQLVPFLVLTMPVIPRKIISCIRTFNI